MESLTYQEAIERAGNCLRTGEPVKDFETDNYNAFDFAAIIGAIFEKNRSDVFLDIANFNRAQK